MQCEYSIYPGILKIFYEVFLNILKMLMRNCTSLTKR